MSDNCAPGWYTLICLSMLGCTCVHACACVRTYLPCMSDYACTHAGQTVTSLDLYIPMCVCVCVFVCVLTHTQCVLTHTHTYTASPSYYGAQVKQQRLTKTFYV